MQLIEYSLPTMTLTAANLTLKVTKVFLTRWCQGSLEPPLENQFVMNITLYLYTKMIAVSKWRPNDRFPFRVISILWKI